MSGFAMMCFLGCNEEQGTPFHRHRFKHVDISIHRDGRGMMAHPRFSPTGSLHLMPRTPYTKQHATPCDPGQEFNQSAYLCLSRRSLHRIPN